MNRSLFTTLALVSIAALSGCASTQNTSASAAQAATSASASASTAASGATQAAAEFGRVTVDELSASLDRHEQVAIYDNNRRERYEQGHIPGARWVSYDAVSTDVLPADRNARLVFYCANESCHACHTAAARAIELGYRNVAILPAGIMGWTAANKPVVTGANPS